MKLTDQQKAEKKLRDQLAISHNRVTSAWSFGQLKTWWDVLVKIGYSVDYINTHSTELLGPEHRTNQPVKFDELKAWLQKQKDSLEERIRNENSSKQEGQKETAPVIQTAVKDTVKVPEQIPDNDQIRNLNRGNSSSTETDEKDKDYGLKPSPNESVKLFWFQKKAAAELLKGLGL